MFKDREGKYFYRDKYVNDLKSDRGAKPGNYWKDTSHNDIIRSFMGQKDFDITEPLEALLSGGFVKVKLCEDLSYDLLHSSAENFWSILYLTGYLTTLNPEEMQRAERQESDEVYLKIPNEEVKAIFSETIVEWFQDNMKTMDRTALMKALWEGQEAKSSELLTDLLFDTISYHNYREDYYHAFLTGVFVGLGYVVESDKEHGEGRPDLIIKDKEKCRVMIIETKYSLSREAMERDCEKAVNQIFVQKYARDFLDVYKHIVCYGAAFYKKQCKVKQMGDGMVTGRLT